MVNRVAVAPSKATPGMRVMAPPTRISLLEVRLDGHAKVIHRANGEWGAWEGGFRVLGNQTCLLYLHGFLAG